MVLFDSIAGSSNGRTSDSGSEYLGSSPSPATRIKLASESRKFARAARSAAQGEGAVSWTFLFCRCRFKNSEAEDFWREDFKTDGTLLVLMERDYNRVVTYPHYDILKCKPRVYYS